MGKRPSPRFFVTSKEYPAIHKTSGETGPQFGPSVADLAFKT